MASSYNELFGLGSHSEDAALEGWWPLLDDAASTTVDDASANSRDLTLSTNTSTLSTTGPNGWLTKSLNFDGTNFTAQTTDSTIIALPQTYAMTVLGRGRQVASSTSDTLWCFDGTDDLVLYGHGGTSGGERVFWRDLGGSIISVTGSGFASAWHDWAFVTRASNDHEVYRDGSSTGTSSATGSAGPFTKFVLGDFSTQDWDGEISEHAIFSRALIVAEIQQWGDGPEPINTVAPVVSGTETVGSTLSCTTGTWGLDAPFSGGSNGTITYAYQWTRSDDGTGTNEADIGGATSSTYTLVAGDSGKYIRCRVRASNDGGFDSAADTNSNFTGAITGGGGDPEGSLTRGKLVGGGLLITGVLV